MDVDAICLLPVADLAAPGAHLYLWTTNRFLRDAFDVLMCWGFRHVATLAWCKQRGLGSGGVFYSNLEFILHARRAKGPAIPTPARVHSRWFDWPRSEHSAKPEAFLDLVESVSPGPYLEMFARRNRLGWDTFGDEALQHVELSA